VSGPVVDETGQEPWRPGVGETAAQVVRVALERPPTLGRSRLVCVDGPAGSGKSTLGRAIVATGSRVGSSALVQVDDLLDGWDGLPDVARTLERDVLAPLSEGRPGSYRRYDWHAEAFAERHLVEPVDLLVVEGVSAGASSYSPWITVLVWVEAAEDLRLARGMARDGESLRPQWLRWMEAEESLLTRERTRDRADIVVDSGASVGTAAAMPGRLSGGSPRRLPSLRRRA
jgi:uridine kinase